MGCNSPSSFNKKKKKKIVFFIFKIKKQDLSIMGQKKKRFLWIKKIMLALTLMHNNDKKKKKLAELVKGPKVGPSAIWFALLSEVWHTHNISECVGGPSHSRQFTVTRREVLSRCTTCETGTFFSFRSYQSGHILKININSNKSHCRHYFFCILKTFTQSMITLYYPKKFR